MNCRVAQVIKQALERSRMAKKAEASGASASSAKASGGTKPAASSTSSRAAAPSSNGSRPKKEAPTATATATAGAGAGASSASSKPAASSKPTIAPKQPDDAELRAQKRERFGLMANTKKASGMPSLLCAEKKKLNRAGSVLVCSTCGEGASLRRMPDLKSGVFCCPSCRIRALDPFSPLLPAEKGMLKLLLVHHMVPENANQEGSFDLRFNLPHLQRWRKQGEEIEVRMVRLDNCDPLQEWPHSLSFFVNGHVAFEIKAPKEGHKRREVPQRISASLKSGQNALKVSLKDGFSVQRFCMAIVRVKPQTPRELCKIVTPVGEEACRQLVSQLLFSSMLESTGEECHADGSDHCRLICPITLARIETPVRGHKCRHLQCFDLKAYLVSNQRMAVMNKRWACPVCSLILKPPADLFIDMHMMQIMVQTEDDDEEVTFDTNGVWTVSAKATPPGPPSSDEEDCGEPNGAANEEDEAEAERDPCASPDDAMAFE
ncbi:unnamed protein product, partial [Polarella glacialis]